MKVHGVITKTGKRVFITFFSTHFIRVLEKSDFSGYELKRGDVFISERELMKISLYNLKTNL